MIPQEKYCYPHTGKGETEAPRAEATSHAADTGQSGIRTQVCPNPVYFTCPKGTLDSPPTQAHGSLVTVTPGIRHNTLCRGDTQKTMLTS